MESHEYKLLAQQLDAMTRLVNAQFETVHDKLNGIDKQVTKTNGRVTEAEKQIQAILSEDKRFKEEYKANNNNHILQCPVAPKVRVLEDNALSAKSVRGWIYASVFVTAAVITMIFTLFKMVTGSV